MQSLSPTRVCNPAHSERQIARSVAISYATRIQSVSQCHKLVESSWKRRGGQQDPHSLMPRVALRLPTSRNQLIPYKTEARSERTGDRRTKTYSNHTPNQREIWGRKGVEESTRVRGDMRHHLPLARGVVHGAGRGGEETMVVESSAAGLLAAARGREELVRVRLRLVSLYTTSDPSNRSCTGFSNSSGSTSSYSCSW